MTRKNGETWISSDIEIAALEHQVRAFQQMRWSRNAWRAAAIFGLLCMLWSTWEMVR